MKDKDKDQGSRRKFDFVGNFVRKKKRSKKSLLVFNFLCSQGKTSSYHPTPDNFIPFHSKSRTKLDQRGDPKCHAVLWAGVAVGGVCMCRGAKVNFEPGLM